MSPGHRSMLLMVAFVPLWVRDPDLAVQEPV